MDCIVCKATQRMVYRRGEISCWSKTYTESNFTYNFIKAPKEPQYKATHKHQDKLIM